jgi:hypothetical protein
VPNSVKRRSQSTDLGEKKDVDIPLLHPNTPSPVDAGQLAMLVASTAPRRYRRDIVSPGTCDSISEHTIDSNYGTHSLPRVLT